MFILLFIIIRSIKKKKEGKYLKTGSIKKRTYNQRNEREQVQYTAI